MNAAPVALAMFISAILLGSTLAFRPAYAHTFQGGESAEFLTMVEVMGVETSLAAENRADAELAAEHMEHAGEQLTDHILEEIAERNERIARDLPASLEELESAISSNASDGEVSQRLDALNNLLGEAVTVRIESDQLNNSTIKAVVISNLVNEALEHYGEAIGFEGNMTDMSTMNMTDSGMESGSMGGMEGSMEGPVEIVSEANYQSSLAFAQRAEELYAEIKADALQGTDDAVAKLDAGFPDFVSAIESRATAMEVMRVAHADIHPNLMVAYDLQIIPEFPLPLLLLIPAITGAIIYGRFFAKFRPA
jgi:hypothetical protein